MEPRRKIPNSIHLSFERDFYPEVVVEPLPPELIEFLKQRRVLGQVTADMLWQVEEQITGWTETKFKFPIYRKPYAHLDITPEAGPLPRFMNHFCLCPDRQTGDWYYLIVLSEDERIPAEEKLAKIIARLNEKAIS